MYRWHGAVNKNPLRRNTGYQKVAQDGFIGSLIVGNITFNLIWLPGIQIIQIGVLFFYRIPECVGLFRNSQLLYKKAVPYRKFTVIGVYEIQRIVFYQGLRKSQRVVCKYLPDIICPPARLQRIGVGQPPQIALINVADFKVGFVFVGPVHPPHKKVRIGCCQRGVQIKLIAFCLILTFGVIAGFKGGINRIDSDRIFQFFKF